MNQKNALLCLIKEQSHRLVYCLTCFCFAFPKEIYRSLNWKKIVGILVNKQLLHCINFNSFTSFAQQHQEDSGLNTSFTSDKVGNRNV